MSSQLDILALEPFFGGVRRSVLETLIRTSRHRWTLLKLPPRRIERRLTAAAHWFSEQLSRHWVGRVDLIFTSDALNLADFYRLMPDLADKPAVVYFHDNQLPAMGAEKDGPLDLVNLNSATAAGEIWFNSKFHLEDFFGRAAYLVERHPELSSRSPIQDLIGKTKLMPSPLDLNVIRDMMNEQPAERQKRTIFVETRDADIGLLNAALSMLVRRNMEFNLVTVGPVETLLPTFPRRTVGEEDLPAQLQGMMQSPVFLSTRMANPFDPHVVRALCAGCWPLLPKSGCYPEILPKSLHGRCLYQPNLDQLSSRLMDIWYEDRPFGFQNLINKALIPYDAMSACKNIDERIEQLVKKDSGPDQAALIEAK